MPDPTPHIENSKVDGGDRVNPVITDVTNGGMDNSRIWHTKSLSSNKNYFLISFQYFFKNLTLKNNL